MDGTLAQLVCLATYGTEWLARPHGDPPDPHRGNSTFQYVATVTFAGPATWPDVPSWLTGLRDRGARALRLHRINDSWVLVAETGSGQEAWRPNWSVTAPHAWDKRIWAVRYDAEGIAVDVRTPPVGATAAELRAAVEQAEAFARRAGATFWADWFARALAAEGTFRYHDDMVPPAFPAERRRLAAMAEQAFVFGGMGSWNDVVIEPEAEYRAVSDRLYAALLPAFVAAVNG